MKSESCAESPRAHSFPCKRGGGGRLKIPFCGTNHVRTDPFSVTGHLIGGAIKSINIRAKKKKKKSRIGRLHPAESMLHIIFTDLGKDPPTGVHYWSVLTVWPP